MDFKKNAADRALDFIEENSLVGLGAGSTVAYLAALLKEKINAGFRASFVTSSQRTLQLLQQHGLAVQPMEYTRSVDLYFDGCDQVDSQLNALKSGGGIHTQEKLLAQMARAFIIMVDEPKFVSVFDSRIPLVVELIPQAILYVPEKLFRLPAAERVIIREGDKKDGPVITVNGNYLADVWFEKWPALQEIQSACKSIAGLVETSLFYGMADKVIIAGETGTRVIEADK